MNNRYTVVMVILAALMAAAIVAQVQTAEAKSFIGRAADGYEAGKAAAKHGRSDTCPSVILCFISCGMDLGQKRN